MMRTLGDKEYGRILPQGCAAYDTIVGMGVLPVTVRCVGGTAMVLRGKADS